VHRRVLANRTSGTVAVADHRHSGTVRWVATKTFESGEAGEPALLAAPIQRMARYGLT